MAYCANCGNELSDPALACPRCGQPTPASSEQRAPVPEAGPGAAALRPLGIGEILDAAVKLYRDNFLTLIKVVAVVVVPVQILGALIVASAAPGQEDLAPPGFEPTAPGQAPEVDPSIVFVFLGGTLLFAALVAVAVQLATAASLRAVGEAYLGGRPEWSASLRFAFRRIGPLLWILILSGVLMFVGFLLCVLPGIWLAVAWSVAIPAMLVEDRRGWEALKRSFGLVRHRWWPTFAALALGWIIVTLVSTVLGAVIQLPFGLIGGTFLTEFFTSAIGDSVAQVLTTPFVASVVAIIYFDLRVRKEGFDLELLAQRIGADEGDASGGPAGEPGAGPQPAPGSGPGPGGGESEGRPPGPRRKPDPSGPAWESHEDPRPRRDE